MEYMRTQASIEKFVIITMRDGRKKYVGRRYSFKMDYGYTVKINEAMMFDTEKRHRIFRHTRMHKSMEIKNLAEATIRLNQPQESAYRRKE